MNRSKNNKLDKRRIYVILMEGSNGIYFTGDKWEMKPFLFNQVEVRKALLKCQKLMKDKSTALKQVFTPKIKRWDYLTNGIGNQTSLNLTIKP